MTGEAFLDLALKLAAATDEARLRTSISRAYYGAFHIARQFLLELGVEVPAGPQAHGFLWLRLQNCGVAEAAAAGDALTLLRTKRNAADYDLSRTNYANSPQVLSCIADAQDLAANIARCRTEPLRSQVVAGVKKYESAISGHMKANPPSS